MTVAELKQLLDRMNDNQEIKMEVPTHNYWGHVKAKSISGIERVDVKYSEYNECDIIVEEDDGREELKQCLILV